MANKFRVVARLGTADSVPSLINGEFGYDVDLKRLRVGDDTSVPTIVPTNKSVGEVVYSQFFTPSYANITIQEGGKVGGVSLESMNTGPGLVVREDEAGEFRNRQLASSSGHLTFVMLDPLEDDPEGTPYVLDVNPSEKLLDLIASGGGNKFSYGPDEPSNSKPGDEWYSTTDDIIYKRVGPGVDPADHYWIDILSFSGGGGGLRFFHGDLPPPTASTGDEWYDRTEGRVYKCLLNNGSNVWVDMQI